MLKSRKYGCFPLPGLALKDYLNLKTYTRLWHFSYCVVLVINQCCLNLYFIGIPPPSMPITDPKSLTEAVNYAPLEVIERMLKNNPELLHEKGKLTVNLEMNVNTCIGKVGPPPPPPIPKFVILPEA